MSTLPSRRAVLAGLASGGGLLAMAGCGFQPVYMPTASGNPGPAERELAAVSVGIIPERPGQLLRQALQARFGNERGTLAKYDLLVSFGIAGEGVAVLQESTPTRIRLIGNANWRLVRIAAPRTQLTSGRARAFDGANLFNQQYFALDLENEAVQQRLATALADQIAMQLSVWFRQRATEAG
jgi:LPS-assembly lipoprotein